MHLEAWQWLIIVPVTFVAAVVQGTIGFGYAVLSVPLLSLVNPQLVPVPQILSALPLSLITMTREWSAADITSALWILLGRIPGALLGAFILTVLTSATLDLLIGTIVLGAVFVLATPVKLKRSRAVDFGVSIFATACGYISAIGGPPIAMLFRDAKGPTLRATLGFLFSIGIVISLSVRGVTHQLTTRDLLLGLTLSPIVVSGVWTSKHLHVFVDRGRVLRHSVLAVSAIAALGLLLRAGL